MGFGLPNGTVTPTCRFRPALLAMQPEKGAALMRIGPRKAAYFMPTIHVQRDDLSVEEVSGALRQNLGASYRITPSVTSTGFGTEVPGDANTAVVKGFWINRANIRIVSVQTVRTSR